MTALLSRKSVFCAQVETTVGTAETIDGSDGAFNARDFVIQPTIAMTRREGQGGFNYLPSIPEGMMGTCTITHDIAYDGTNIPTWASVLLPACGYVDTAGVFSPVTQGPGGAGGVKTLTIAQYIDGKRRMLSGAMGNFVINLQSGKVGTITFTFTGKYHVNETDTAIVSPTYPSTLPLRVADGAVTFNSVAKCAATVTIDSGNNVVMRECVESGNRTGYKSAIITDRAPIITADIETVLAATQDMDSLWLTPTPAAWSFTLNGTGSSSVAFSAPKAQIESKENGDRNGIAVDNTTWFCTAGSSADTELVITFTATS